MPHSTKSLTPDSTLPEEPDFLLFSSGFKNALKPAQLTSIGYSFFISSKGNLPHSEFIQRFGKSRHCCGFTDCTAQFSPSRKMHSPFGFSGNASPPRSQRSRVNCWMKSGSLKPLNAASRVISASVKRTCPDQRQQAVQR